jgi:hypothetical protein
MTSIGRQLWVTDRVASFVGVGADFVAAELLAARAALPGIAQTAYAGWRWPGVEVANGLITWLVVGMGRQILSRAGLPVVEDKPG